MTDASMRNHWQNKLTYHNVMGHRVAVYQTVNPELPYLVILHGFPSHSQDFEHAIPLLAEYFNVVVHDHLGFGYSDKPETYSYSLLEQAEIALKLWQQLGIQSAHLLAHDYGTSVATEILARRQRLGIDLDLKSVTLCNGSVHIELADLTWEQKAMRSQWLAPIFVRLMNRPLFKRKLFRILGPGSSASDADLNAMWQGMVHNHGRYRLPQLSQYLHERFRFWHRWIGALQQLDIPCHILWGRCDPIAVPAIAKTLAEEIPAAQLNWLDDLGHYPMLEAPQRWSQAALLFLKEVDRQA